MTKVYVVAKFEKASEAQAVMGILREQGYEVTHDWTGETVDGLSGTAVIELLQGASERDLNGVLEADAVVVLHHPNLRNGLVEIGAALGKSIPVIVIGATGALDPAWMFYWHCDVVHVGNVDEAVHMLDVLFPEQEVDRTNNVIDFALEKARREGCAVCEFCCEEVD